MKRNIALLLALVLCLALLPVFTACKDEEDVMAVTHTATIEIEPCYSLYS